VPCLSCISMAALLATSGGIVPCPVNNSLDPVLRTEGQVGDHRMLSFARASRSSSTTRRYSPIHPGKERIPYDRSPDCGAKCLYLLLSYLGDRRDFATVLAAVPRLSDRGASLADLQEAAREFGLTTTVAQGATDRLPLPAIARLLPRVASGDGHFVLLYKVTPEEVAYIDGTTGALVRRGRTDFDGHFSGFALIPQAATGMSEQFGCASTILKFIVAGEAVILLLILVYSQRRDLVRTTRRAPS
jgi:hypothetical protein